MNRCAIWNSFVLNLCQQQVFRSYGLLSRVMYEERIIHSGWQYTITNSHFKIPVFLVQSSNKVQKIRYVTVNQLIYNLGQTNS